MLVLSEQQKEDMLMADEERFVDFVVRHVQTECRDSVRDIDPVSLREMVANGLARARGHGLGRAKDLTAFVALMFEIAPNFDEQADIRRALADPSVPIDRRFDAMLEGVPDRAWDEAEKRRNPAAWFPELLDGRQGP